MTVALTIEQLLNSPTKTVDVAGVGTVVIRPVSALAHDEASAAADDVETGERRAAIFAARLCAYALVEPACDDWEKLASMPIGKLWPLFDAVNAYSGVDDGEVGERVDQFPVSGNTDDTPQTDDTSGVPRVLDDAEQVAT